MDPYRVLAESRAVIARGWVQNRWLARRPAAASAGTPDDRDNGNDVTAACLVGAILQTVRRRGYTDDLVDAGPVLDVVWDAWQESRGLGGPGVAGRAAPTAVRAARVRDLTRWNDQPGRTREEVLHLLDVATARAIMAELGALPAGVPSR